MTVSGWNTLGVAPATFAPVQSLTVNPVVRAALYLFVASIPFEVPDRTIPLEVPTLTGFLFLGATLLNPSACYRRVGAPLVWFAVYLWIFGIATYAARVQHTGEALRLFVAMAQLVWLFWVISNVLADPKVVRGVLLALVFACAIRAGMQILGLAVTEQEQWTGGVRLTVLGQNPNLSAIILASGLAIVLGLRGAGAGGLPRLGILAWLLAILLGAAVIQTGSRGGLLCAGMGAVAYLIRGRTVAQRAGNAILALLVIGSLAWGAYQSDMMRHRFEQVTETGYMAGRERIYPALLAMFSERPLLGWGPVDNQFEVARRLRETKPRDAHNLVLELLTTTGLLGAVPFLIGMVLCLRAAWRARAGPAGSVPLALLLAAITGTLAGTWIASKIVWLAMAVAAGAPQTVWTRDVPGRT